MTDPTLRINPRVLPAFRDLLEHREQVLWCDRRRGLGKRERRIAMVSAIVISVCLSVLWVIGWGGLLPILLFVWGPTLLWYFMRLNFRYFAVTDRRVLFTSPVWPRLTAEWAYHLMNPHLIRHGERSSIIHLHAFFAYFGANVRGFWSYLYAGSIPRHIENVPEIEAVRQLILEQIANAEAPQPKSPEPARKHAKPRIHGTMTG